MLSEQAASISPAHGQGRGKVERVKGGRVRYGKDESRRRRNTERTDYDLGISIIFMF